jgi:hypothetical protein
MLPAMSLGNLRGGAFGASAIHKICTAFHIPIALFARQAFDAACSVAFVALRAPHS